MISLGGFRSSNKLNCPKVSYTIQRLESFWYRTAITWSFNNATDFKPPSITRRRFDYASIDHVTCYMLPFHRCHFTTQRSNWFFLLITSNPKAIVQGERLTLSVEIQKHTCPRIHTSVIYDIGMSQTHCLLLYSSSLKWIAMSANMTFFLNRGLS